MNTPTNPPPDPTGYPLPPKDPPPIQCETEEEVLEPPKEDNESE
jgi:hypothetical protein